MTDASELTRNMIARYLGFSVGRLDEQVCDLKADEAAVINNQGKAAQVAYILGTDLSLVIAIADELGIEG